jgi:hypothetical protein
MEIAQLASSEAYGGKGFFHKVFDASMFAHAHHVS